MQQREVITEYVRENQAALYRLAFGYVRNREAAMDIVQDAIVNALTHATSLRTIEAVRPWFYRILVNEALAHLRRNKRVYLVDELEDCLPAKERDLGEKIDVYRAVQRLKSKLKTVVLLRFYEDMKFDEIAKVTGVPVSTVKSRLKKALELLKEELGEKGGGI